MYSSFADTTNVQYDEDACLGLMKHLDKSELQAILDDDSRLNDIINDLQQVKNEENGKQTIIEGNKSLADYNLSKKPRLEQAKRELGIIYEDAVSWQKKFDENKQKVAYHATQQSLDSVLAVLQTEAAKAEEDSEELTDAFMSGNTEVEDFVEKYVNARTLSHLRKIKAEKMQELLRERQLQNNHQPSSTNHVGNTTNWGGGYRY